MRCAAERFGADLVANDMVGVFSCAVHAAPEGVPVNEHHIAEAASKFAIHVLVLIVWLALVVTGLGLSVTMVGLPLGLPIGLVGVLVCLWGLYGTIPEKSSAPPSA